MFYKAISSRSAAVTILAALFCSATAMADEPVPADPSAAKAQTCPSELAEYPCSVDLVSGTLGEACFYEPFYRIHSAPADSDGDGWREAVVGVDLTQECSRLCVVLDYTESPAGWTFNLGDSASNNGYGGNNGGPESESEVQIKDDRLTLWSIGLGSSILDRVAEADLQLENGSYKVCVSDQKVTFGQPQSRAATPNSKLLFALPDGGTSPPNSQVFIGLNRVIDALGGAPFGGRIGSGLRRAYLTLD